MIQSKQLMKNHQHESWNDQGKRIRIMKQIQKWSMWMYLQ